MSDIAIRIKALIRESEIPIKVIAEGSGVSKDKLWNFVSGRTPDLSAGDADKVKVYLTGEGLQ